MNDSSTDQVRTKKLVILRSVTQTEYVGEYYTEVKFVTKTTRAGYLETAWDGKQVFRELTVDPDAKPAPELCETIKYNPSPAEVEEYYGEMEDWFEEMCKKRKRDRDESATTNEDKSATTNVKKKRRYWMVANLTGFVIGVATSLLW